MSNPWAYNIRGIGRVQTADARPRTEKVRDSTDSEWLRAVIAWPHTQKTVRLAAERRLRKLARQQ